MRHVYRAIGQFKNLFVLSNKCYTFHKIFLFTKTSISIIRRSVPGAHVAAKHTDNNKLGLKRSERRQMTFRRETNDDRNEMRKNSPETLFASKFYLSV